MDKEIPDAIAKLLQDLQKQTHFSDCYFVCDESNNPPASIADGFLVIDYYGPDADKLNNL